MTLGPAIEWMMRYQDCNLNGSDGRKYHYGGGGFWMLYSGRWYRKMLEQSMLSLTFEIPQNGECEAVRQG